MMSTNGNGNGKTEKIGIRLSKDQLNCLTEMCKAFKDNGYYTGIDTEPVVASKLLSFFLEKITQEKDDTYLMVLLNMYGVQDFRGKKIDEFGLRQFARDILKRIQ